MTRLGLFRSIVSRAVDIFPTEFSKVILPGAKLLVRSTLPNHMPQGSVGSSSLVYLLLNPVKLTTNSCDGFLGVGDVGLSFCSNSLRVSAESTDILKGICGYSKQRQYSRYGRPGMQLLSQAGRESSDGSHSWMFLG